MQVLGLVVVGVTALVVCMVGVRLWLDSSGEQH
jgi:hypothetical protein